MLRLTLVYEHAHAQSNEPKHDITDMQVHGEIFQNQFNQACVFNSSSSVGENVQTAA